MTIELNNIKLSLYDNNNSGHINLLMDLEGESKSEYIHDIRARLIEGNLKKDFPFGVGFVVSFYDKVVGYVFISKRIKDEIFLEYSLSSKYRGKGYGKILLDEVSFYLMDNYNIKSISLDIDPSNLPSISTALSVGYVVDDEEYINRGMEGKILYRMDNYNYINKRKK